MKSTTSTLFITAFMAITFPLNASTIPFAFSTPNGSLGFSEMYLDDSIAITARGYTGVDSPNTVGAALKLYGKNGGGAETGLGLVGTGDYEIVGNDFIQLDFSDVKNKMLNPTAQLMIGSVQTGEYYRIYGSNTVGMAGTMLVANGSINGQFFNIPKFNQYTYFSVSAPKGDVLLDAASVAGQTGAPVPEPGTFSLLGCAAIALSLLSRGVRAQFRKAAGRVTSPRA